MGIWTGLLNNKVGNFKFIYVDVLEEEEPPQVRQQKVCKGPSPQSLLELLQSLNLEVRSAEWRLLLSRSSKPMLI